MINGYYKPNEEITQETIPKEHDTRQDKERSMTTPALQGTQDKEQHFLLRLTAKAKSSEP
jgi:hypothetical protein